MAHALLTQQRPLVRAGGGVDLRAHEAGQMGGGLAHPPGGGVDQHPVSGLNPGQPVQRVVRRDVPGDQAGRLDEVQVRWLAHGHGRGHRHAATHQPEVVDDHVVAHDEVRVGTGGDNRARGLEAERLLAELAHHAERVEDVLEVQAHRLDLDLDLGPGRRDVVEPLRSDPGERAVLPDGQPEAVVLTRAPASSSNPIGLFPAVN